ncbi:MAG: hypothetical protein AAB367_01015 [Patescibacteria group bacterium]
MAKIDNKWSIHLSSSGVASEFEKGVYAGFLMMAELCFKQLFLKEHFWGRLMRNFEVKWFWRTKHRGVCPLRRCLICGSRMSPVYELRVKVLGHDGFDIPLIPLPTPQSDFISYDTPLFTYCERGHAYLHTWRHSKLKGDDTTPSLHVYDPGTQKLECVKYWLIPGFGGPSSMHLQWRTIRNLRRAYAEGGDTGSPAPASSN